MELSARCMCILHAHMLAPAHGTRRACPILGRRRTARAKNTAPAMRGLASTAAPCRTSSPPAGGCVLKLGRTSCSRRPCPLARHGVLGGRHPAPASHGLRAPGRPQERQTAEWGRVCPRGVGPVVPILSQLSKPRRGAVPLLTTNELARCITTPATSNKRKVGAQSIMSVSNSFWSVSSATLASASTLLNFCKVSPRMARKPSPPLFGSAAPVWSPKSRACRAGPRPGCCPSAGPPTAPSRSCRTAYRSPRAP